MLNAGERWDVVLHASRPVDKYWVRVRALGDCGENKSRVFQRAVLVYSGSNAAQPAGTPPDFDTSRRDGKVKRFCFYMTIIHLSHHICQIWITSKKKSYM